MSVLIQINGENAGEAIKELSTLAAGITGQIAPALTDAPKADKSSSRRTTKPEPTKETPENDPEEEEVAEEVEDEDDGSAPVPTVVELRAKASEVGTSPEAKKAIKALLDKFGSKSVSEVPEAKRAAFLKELEAI